MISPLDQAQSRAARIAGFAFLFAIATVILANYGVNFRYIIPGDAAATARNLVAHGTLFRLNSACNLVYLLANLALMASLYVILKPVEGTLALVATFCRLVYALIWSLAALNTLSALRLLNDPACLQVFRIDQLQILAKLHLSASWDAYYVGLPFWGLASTVWSGLLLKSRQVPRWLAVYGVLASSWCVFCAFTFLVFPHFDQVVGASWFDVPLVLFEFVLGLRLLFKGLSPSRADVSA